MVAMSVGCFGLNPLADVRPRRVDRVKLQTLAGTVALGTYHSFELPGGAGPPYDQRLFEGTRGTHGRPTGLGVHFQGVLAIL